MSMVLDVFSTVDIMLGNELEAVKRKVICCPKAFLFYLLKSNHRSATIKYI